MDTRNSVIATILAFSDVNTILIGLCVFILVWFYHRNTNKISKDESSFPDGFVSWRMFLLLPSILVNGLLKGLYFHELLILWGKKYNGVFFFGLPGLRMLVINDFEALREAFKHPDLNDRAPNMMRDFLFKGKGLLFSSGETWREQRKFSSSVLRSFGVGKRSFEKDIAEESKYLIEKLRTLNGKEFNPTHLICNSVANVICSVTFGKRYDYEDTQFKQMMEYIELILERQIENAVFTESCPPLIHMPFGPIKTFRNYLVEYRQCIRDVIEDHRKTFDSKNLRDFIDVYFEEMQLKRAQGIDTKLTEANMEATVEDLFLAGSETTATTLRWSILMMMAYPEVQSRIQRELDDVTGRNRLPTLADRPNLPYTEATIQEIMRYGTIAPIGAPHYTHVDTTFRGYKIPKGTMVIGNLWSISRDPVLWNDKDIGKFNPERFLDDNCNVVKKLDHHIVFGSGKRACIGEQLAKMEVFIFFTHLLHQFSIKKPHDSKPINLRGKAGAVHSPLPYEACLIGRDV